MNDTTVLATDTTTWTPRDGATPQAQRLLHGPGLTLVRISFRPGQTLDDHRAPGPILVTCVSGTIDLTVTEGPDAGSHTLTDGTVLYIAPGDTHRLTAHTDAVVHVTLQRNTSTD